MIYFRKYRNLVKYESKELKKAKEEIADSPLLSSTLQVDDKLSDESEEQDYNKDTTIEDHTREIRLRRDSFDIDEHHKPDKLLESETKYKSTFMRSTVKMRTKIFEGIKNVTHELSEVEHPQDNNIYMEKKHKSPKDLKLTDLKVMNLVFCILTVWGVAISTPYYLLAAPLYNVWRFLVLFGHYLVVAVFSGHCVPELIIMTSTFVG